MKQARILIVDLARYYGGGEVRVINLAQALHDAGLDYAVVTLPDSPVRQRLESRKLNVIAPAPFKRGDPRMLLFLLRAIKREKFTVVDGHNVQSSLWGNSAGRLAGVTCVATVHSNYRLEHDNSNKGRFYEWVLRFNRLLGVRFIAVSEAVNDYLKSLGVPQARVTLIHNALKQPEPSPEGRNLPLFQSLGWTHEHTVLIHVARVEPVKGHTYLIEALSRIKADYPKLRCLFVGDGRTRPELEQQAERQQVGDIVHFAGFRDDVPDLLGASDIFCLPSLSEALPYALLEACAVGLPPLVSQVGGMAEVLDHLNTAWLAEPGDVDNLTQGLRWLLDHPAEAQAMGRRAQRWSQETFSPQRMIEQTLTVYGVK
jgi:glycosyltransferase involved in cell wall biosynthesis